ncbi:MAG: 16S rRNA (cytidine(1402)-2'-O)-methyltransferase [Balneolaceae bacterium]
MKLRVFDVIFESNFSPNPLQVSTLFIVATPIGNLGDISPRAIEILNMADQIGCEDTRTSGKLLGHYGVETPTFPFHQHNEHRKVKHLMNLLDGGLNIALISDAGMPGISDPGFLAVRAAWQHGHTVTVIPGPDACTTALAASGLPCDRYLFEGFLPPKKGRQTRLQEISRYPVTTVIYESPHRLLRLLEELEEHAGEERWVAIARELTKKFEEVQRGRLGDLRRAWIERDVPKGEFVIILAAQTYSD